MNSKRKLHAFREAGAILVALSITGCAGSQAATPANALTSQAESGLNLEAYGLGSVGSSGTGPLLYVSLLSPIGDNSAVYYFSQNGLYLLGEITNGIANPEGLAIDKKGSLYVTNPPNKNVAVYLRGQSTPSVTYTDKLTNPLDVVVDKKGWVYVANATIPGGGVVSYPPGSTNASGKYVQLSGFAPQGVALDGAGNLYVDYTGSGSPQVYKYPPHKTKGVSLGLTIGAPIGIAVDDSKNLLVVDRESPYNSGLPAIEIYPPDTNKPSKVITNANFSMPAMLEFNKKQNRLYVADCGQNLNHGEVFVFSYPSANLLNTLSNFPSYSCPNGVALSPAAP